jgi:hypothetical protein
MRWGTERRGEGDGARALPGRWRPGWTAAGPGSSWRRRSSSSPNCFSGDPIESNSFPGGTAGRLVCLGIGFRDLITTNLGMKSAARERTRSGLVLFFPGNFCGASVRQLPNSTRLGFFASRLSLPQTNGVREEG